MSKPIKSRRPNPVGRKIKAPDIKETKLPENKFNDILSEVSSRINRHPDINYNDINNTIDMLNNMYNNGQLTDEYLSDRDDYFIGQKDQYGSRRQGIGIEKYNWTGLQPTGPLNSIFVGQWSMNEPSNGYLVYADGTTIKIESSSQFRNIRKGGKKSNRKQKTAKRNSRKHNKTLRKHKK
uniref:Uncharacterized protein n=1 Tax=viral metagenome TaxID=1070528 RepID=A0A6C0LPT7_9ZZZZ